MRIQILGPFNTGTNLISKICKNNLSQNVTIHDEGHTIINKHTIDLTQIEYVLSQPDTVAILMYKALPNWIYSIRKAPYEISWTQRGILFRGQLYPTLVHLHNHYYRMYMTLLERPNVVFLDYHAIIKRGTSFKYVNQQLAPLGLQLQSARVHDRILSVPAKRHGRPVNADRAMTLYGRIHNQIWREIRHRSQLASAIDLRITAAFEGITLPPVAEQLPALPSAALNTEVDRVVRGLRARVLQCLDTADEGLKQRVSAVFEVPIAEIADHRK